MDVMNQYYYMLQKLENDFIDTSYSELEKELLEHKWEFLGGENMASIIRYRWQFNKKHVILVVVQKATMHIMEVIV